MKKIICSLTSEQPNRQDFFWKWIDRQVRQLVISLAEKVLQLQMQTQLKAGWNERAEVRTGHRNGYYTRWLSSPHGQLHIRVPRPRQGGMDTTLVFDRYQRRIEDVTRILRHAYLLGTSTRGLAQLAEQIFGGSLSHQTISRLMRWLDELLIQWRQQPIKAVYPVVYIDGMHVDMVGSDRIVMLVSGRREVGDMEVLGFSIARGEQCKDLLEDLQRRGLEGVQLFVSDDSGPIQYALEQVYPLVSRQSCTFHRLLRLRTTIGPTKYRNQMVTEAGCVFGCESFGAALDVASDWRVRWQHVHPLAVDRFLYGLRDSLRFYDLPKHWWKRVRTNNPMERLIRSLRQRLRPMGCFQNEEAIERAVFGQLLRWHKIKLTHNT